MRDDTRTTLYAIRDTKYEKILRGGFLRVDMSGGILYKVRFDLNFNFTRRILEWQKNECTSSAAVRPREVRK